MQKIRHHLAQCFVAGIVALLPIAGLVLTIVYFESQVAGTWLKGQGYYFFGMGLLIVALLIYLVGLIVSTFIGRWIWNLIDRALMQLPIVGKLYQTMKQILGYGEGSAGFFKRVVLLSTSSPERWEIGLVTQEANVAQPNLLAVFIPMAPSPINGRLVYIHPDQTLPVSLSVNEALKLLVSLGTIPLAKPLK